MAGGPTDQFTDNARDARAAMVSGRFSQIYVLEAVAATFQPPPGWSLLTDGHERNKKRYTLYGRPTEIP